MRETISLNKDWLFSLKSNPSSQEKTSKSLIPEKISLPHTVCSLPVNGFSEEDYQFISSYRRELQCPEHWWGKRILLVFDGIMGDAELWINGEFFTSFQGGFIPHAVEIQDRITPGQSNTIELVVDSHENPRIPPYGRVVDFLGFGGLYRQARITVYDPISIESIEVHSHHLLSPRPEVEFIVQLSTEAQRYIENADSDLSLQVELKYDGHITDTFTLPSIQNHPVNLKAYPQNLQLWSPETPTLYTVICSIFKGDSNEPQDTCVLRTGFRKIEFRGEGIFCNGQLIKLIGLNRHQTFPYQGAAMPPRIQRRDAEILKLELGVNMVRTSHYPQDPAFLDRCDELGLFVMEEIPGWQFIGDQEWKNQSLEDTKAMILRDRHHPSIILWGVRINESPDDDEFYYQTNQIAKKYDQTRQTGGVRNFRHSHLLEDVYTFNDFSQGDTTPPLLPKQRVTQKRNPYLVTEHTGHTYPTKSFDQEERQIEHTLRHLRIINHARGTRGVSGALGWCAFDYHTHKEFGSGDRICYHGVYDVFRLPKWAASAYSSQKSPASGLVLQPLSLFALGERNGAVLMPLTILTNCDSVRIFRNHEDMGEFYPDFKGFPHLSHPPIRILELIGNRLGAYGFSQKAQRRLRKIFGAIMDKGEQGISLFQRLSLALTILLQGMTLLEARRMFELVSTGWGEAEQIWRIQGRIGGEPVIEKTFGSSYAKELRVIPDDYQLSCGDPDATRVSFQIMDQHGNPMPYINEAVKLTLSGPAELNGPSLLSLHGGAAAIWIRSSGEPGTIHLKVENSRFPDIKITIPVI